MGTNYTTTSVSGYNTNPPPDDASQVEANKIKWSHSTSKIGTPLKNAVDSINTKLLSAFDFSTKQIVGTYTTLASDHMATVEIASTVTNTFTISLADAVTMTNNYIVRIANQSALTHTIGRETGGDTINGVAANLSIRPQQTMTFAVNSGADGYLLLAESLGPEFFAGSFTRDGSLASGNQTISGLPFRPRAAIFLANVSANPAVSIGFDIASAQGNVYQNIAGGADFFNSDTMASSMNLTTGSGIQYHGAVSSFTADGFIIAWTKVGDFVSGITVNYFVCR